MTPSNRFLRRALAKMLADRILVSLVVPPVVFLGILSAALSM